MNDRTIRFEEDLKTEQGINFLLMPMGSWEYEDRINEVIVPESVFDNIYGLARENKLRYLSKLDIYGGITYHNDKLEDIIAEFEILLTKTDDIKTKKYLELTISMLKEGNTGNTFFYEIGL